MADQKISERATTSDKTGGYLVINVPDAGSPTGFTTKTILVDNYDADLAELIQTNTDDIDTVNDRVNGVYQDLAIRQDVIVTQTTNYEYSQGQGTQIEAIKVYSNFGTASTVKCGLTPEGSEIFDTRNISSAGLLVYRSDKSEMFFNSLGNRTVYFTITGSVRMWINYQILL